MCCGSNLWDVLVPLAAQQPPLQSSGRLVGREGVLKLGRAATQCKVSIIPKDGNEVDCLTELLTASYIHFTLHLTN